ncbi:hypothetical protein Ais01nite_47560 [Asanoa ishikariensis]|nr:hypothetical protein Ais01nite_47560 [Asanoa ishikariensis]
MGALLDGDFAIAQRLPVDVEHGDQHVAEAVTKVDLRQLRPPVVSIEPGATFT